MEFEIRAKQLTESWFATVHQVESDASATEREKKLAAALKDCGTAVNAILDGLANLRVSNLS